MNVLGAYLTCRDIAFGLGFSAGVANIWGSIATGVIIYFGCRALC